ncbi:CocE/NonD family hydrolase [Aliikangiella sp. G2MR2-5]|uniref:CocE/NonD family hydrolase n=1 Tax=Aliikangiella sp. G2MR2-5 TaxID=2788943 RepID=UPI0018ABFEA4|nr:CocE/NonD family hydrolase [Aliikangiella sp. G2MR2-5]
MNQPMNQQMNQLSNWKNLILSLLVMIATCYSAFTSATSATDTEKVPENHIRIPQRLPDLNANTVEDDLAREYLQLAKTIFHPRISNLNNSKRFRFYLWFGKYEKAIESLELARQDEAAKFPVTSPGLFIGQEIYAESKLVTAESSFQEGYAQAFKGKFDTLNDKSAHDASDFVTYSLDSGKSYLEFLHGRVAGKEINLNQPDETLLAQLNKFFVEYIDYQVYKESLALARKLIEDDRNKRYQINKKVIIKTTDGAELSAMIVRSRSLTQKRPAILTATIYSDEENNLQRAIEAAARGYVGVVSDTRGKRLSKSAIVPYEKEVEDIYTVIEWLSQHPWTDGRVAMYGGSYLGYTQWAATKKLHPALKTIVPAVAAMAGLGLPMENNIFLNANYAWTDFVTNKKVNDPGAYSRKNWNQVNDEWYQSGRSYREFDQIAGKPNPWLQKWLDHPGFDDYWQSMIPFEKEYAKINIPVLTLTGYYDDGQISAMHYLKEHYRYNPNAEHYLLIGPYDHFSSQILRNTHLRNYKLDPVALIDMREITFQWFDYVLNGAPKPALLKDKINYQLMTDNSWRHTSSFDELQAAPYRYYLHRGENKTNTENAIDENKLSLSKSSSLDALIQTIDLADRSKSYNNHYYPYPIVQKKVKIDSGFAFVTDEFTQDMELSGSMSGELKVRINKKDLDVGLVLFEIKENGDFHHLSYFLGRASYAKDMNRRHLLKPGEIESIPFERVRMVSKKISKGSRLMLLLNVNMNSFAQVNYGTSKDVSEESIADAGEPLKVEWLNSSYVDLPLKVYHRTGK